jgi:hypothetical protein
MLKLIDEDVGSKIHHGHSPFREDAVPVSGKGETYFPMKLNIFHNTFIF